MLSLGHALPDLSARSPGPELMDDPDLDRGRHHRALEALSRVNRVSFAGARLWQEVRAVRREVAGPVRVLDLACGGGDVLLDVAARARKEGIPVSLRGCDVSPVAVESARSRLGRWNGDGRQDVSFSGLDVVEAPLPEGHHLVTSALFLHHLERAEAIRLLRRMARVARRRIFVQDLRRTRLGYALAWIGLRTLTRSDVARVDGLRSVRSSFTIAEARSLAVEAGLHGAEVRPRWPQRFTIRWIRTGT